MKISVVTPAGKQSRGGNRTTAVRWVRIFRALGHWVRITAEDDGANADMMVAVHAWRSAASIRRFSQAHPDRPLVVALAGTDIYRFQHSHPTETLEAMDRASALVCLHDLVHRAIPARFAGKLRVVLQSAPPLTRPRAPSRRSFAVSVVGHLREEKDPLRAALAARLAPEGSRLRVIHMGRAHDEVWAQRAREEMARNPRYRWLGEVPGWRVRRAFARAHLMVISSVMEGGANVVSEAVVAGLPVIASDVDGNVGLLGPDYKGYYPVGNTDALAKVLWRAESDASFLATLEAQCAARAPLFRPEREHEAWASLLKELEQGKLRGAA